MRPAASAALAVAMLACAAGPARAATVSRSGDTLVLSETTALDATDVTGWIYSPPPPVAVTVAGRSGSARRPVRRS